MALETVCLAQGIPLSYYVDSHSIFRFVQGRDSIWREHRKVTDEADPQWKQVLRDCRIKVIYALSPQAKGKIERPYRWLQDRLVRTCAREHVSAIGQVHDVLDYEVKRYNEHQVHSTTGEIPAIRFERALNEKKTLFRPFRLPSPYESTKDIFCLREKRITNAYRKISFEGIEFKIPVNPYEEVELRMVPNEITGLTDIRFWDKNKLVATQIIKNTCFKRVRF